MTDIQMEIQLNIYINLLINVYAKPNGKDIKQVLMSQEESLNVKFVIIHVQLVLKVQLQINVYHVLILIIEFKSDLPAFVKMDILKSVNQFVKNAASNVNSVQPKMINVLDVKITLLESQIQFSINVYVLLDILMMDKSVYVNNAIILVKPALNLVLYAMIVQSNHIVNLMIYYSLVLVIQDTLIQVFSNVNYVITLAQVVQILSKIV